MKKELLKIGVALCLGVLCLVACSDDDKDESDTKNEENSKNTAGLSGTSGLMLTYNLSKGSAQMVDMGLPSGTKWADRNIGATSPEDCGAYFAWAETRPKTVFDAETYYIPWHECFTKKDPLFGIKVFSGNARFDAATANWGAGYKMPTKAQCDELVNNTKKRWYDGVILKYNNSDMPGCLVKSKLNGNTIFFPASGCIEGTNNTYYGRVGHYWSSTLFDSYPNEPWYLFINPDGCILDNDYYERLKGHSIRPVSN